VRPEGGSEDENFGRFHRLQQPATTTTITCNIRTNYEALRVRTQNAGFLLGSGA